MNIKRDDKVIVLSGKDKGKSGKVNAADPKAEKVIVEGVNVATKHQKAQKKGQDGGIIKVETPIYVNKVQLVCPKCGEATRVGQKVVKKVISGKEKNVRIRVCKKCGAEEI